MNNKSIKILILSVLCISILSISNIVFAKNIKNDTNDNNQNSVIATISENSSYYTSNKNKNTIDEDLKTKIIPYQQLVDKLNSELGSNIKIPEDEETYKKIINVSLEDTERDLRQAYEECQNSPQQ